MKEVNRTPDILSLIVLLLTLVSCKGAQEKNVQIPHNDVWPRPEIIPLPSELAGTEEPVISLNGQWKFTSDPPEAFWRNEVSPTSWKDIKVPAEASFHVEGLNPYRRLEPGEYHYVYKTRIQIPSEFSGKKIKLRFEGVTGTAEAWVNAQRVGEHHGGFTIWNPDITEHVTPGQEAWIAVAVREPSGSTSTNTYRGGIIRDVELVALPETHITRLNIETDLDEQYRDAILKLWLRTEFSDTSDTANINFTLLDPEGEQVTLNPASMELTRKQSEQIIGIPVADPVKWTAEHPKLYTLETRLEVDGKVQETIIEKIGFREVTIDGRKLLVNGNEVKLRGSGQFDSDPLDGKSLSAEDAIRDIQLYKNANHNMIRPSCYITTEDFLAAADSIGMYIMGEMPVTFAAQTSDNEFLLPEYLNQTAETVEQARNHPSIIIWMLANETGYGFNIKKMSHYVHAEDSSRPVMYSWSHRVTPSDPLPYEIYSYHYPSYDVDLSEPGVAVFNGELNREIPPMPVLADEFAHPASYNYEEMRRDPNVRNFWGRSIKIFWEKMFTTRGSLGGAIFAGIDHPINHTNVYPWGLLDKWRRPKPEYWSAKKAFSPVRLDVEQINLEDADALVLPVKNWFDHTNLSEITFTWSVGERTETIQGPDVSPREEGTVRIPFNGLQPGDLINLKIHLPRDNRLIDEYNVSVDPESRSLPSPAGPAPDVSEDSQRITVAGEDFNITFSKQSGLITSGTFGGTPLITDGPYLHIIGAELSDWTLSDIGTSVEDNEVVVTIDGTYQARPEIPRGFDEDEEDIPAREPITVETTLEVRIDGQGLISTGYQIHQFPLEAPETRVVPWNNTNAGGYEEIGVRFLLNDRISSLSWERDGLWSAYPENHIGRNEGVAPRTTENEKQVGIEPDWPWSLDQKDFDLFGPDDPGNRGTNDFRSMKENIYQATALTPEGVGVQALSDGTEAVRLELAGAGPATGVWMHINNEWNYRHLGLGNFMKPPIIIQSGYSDYVYVRFVD
ncbi:hypothetical protein NC796_23775 [Aliifodinibius sp. S!AR15-10]|uniref:glycoside hydrolase family 2 TIM barrel-domain containing protein n=1 Tax=Aliifodinibius sp. S!AR15-10 TaxID=2950437 RepID=UPI00285D33D7|nr:glycoside hydrolase family 2 TIM barrel-domain containing protein [Aliifodinibius sp. S!AR15-10]MDR8394188.1 hypothetical protein [Aliifodinibius sp. S!AR15-10]